MKICVYGSGSKTIDNNLKKIGIKLGIKIAEHNHKLIFGGGDYGMMGAVLKGCLKKDGKTLGISPDFLEEGYNNCSKFIYTDTVYERKKLLRDLSDGFIVSPGGLGTLDEFFEVLTLKQLKRHNKPIVIFNINHYYDEMLKMIDSFVEKQTISKENTKLYKVCTTIDETLEYLETYK